MAMEINPAFFEDELSPGYNSFNEAVMNAVINAMRKRREQGLVNTQPPKSDNAAETATEESAAAASQDDDAAPAVDEQDSPEQGELGLAGAAGDSAEGTEAEEEEKEKKKRDTGKIEDFGEKLGGARKDLYQRYREMIMEVSRDEVALYPLAKLWPKPNYTKLLEEGVEPWKVAMLRVLREDLPRKPKASSYKLRGWTDKFLENRRLAVEILDPDNVSDFDAYNYFGSYQSDETVSKAYMYLNLGADVEMSDFPYHVEYISSMGRVYFNDESYSDCYAVMSDSYPRVVQVFDTASEALDYAIDLNQIELNRIRSIKEAANGIKAELGEKAPARKYDSFQIRQWRAPKSYIFIGIKYNGDWVELKKPFNNGREAREYLDSHMDELQDAFEAYKKVPDVRKLIRRDENLPRTIDGNPARPRDITPEDFMNEFGFRGVEFGNWVENDKRQQNLNEAYDGLMDLSHVLNVPPKALSLCGELGLRFGSNGRGGRNAAKAHYEPDLLAINLTKKMGAGSLAHEWFHAMDHYFNYHNNKGTHILLTESKNLNNIYTYTQNEKKSNSPNWKEYMASRKENYYQQSHIRHNVLEKFVALREAFNSKAPEAEYSYVQRSEKTDKLRSGKPYWGTNVELAARAFEAYVFVKLADEGIRNDFLVNYITPEEYEEKAKANPARMSNTYPYPIPQEMPVIKKAYDELFEAIDTRETEDGKVEMYSSSDYRMARLELCETIFPEELSEVQTELQRFSEAVLELNVEFFDGPESFHGSFDPLENKILLNVGSDKSVDWVLWHESFHAFKELEPETYQELMAYMDTHAPITQEQIAAYKESVHGYDLPDSVVKEELLADAFADMKKREAIIGKMETKAPGLFSKVSNYFSRVKDKAKDFFFGKDEVKLTKEQFATFENAVSELEKRGKKIVSAKAATLEDALTKAQHREDKHREHFSSVYSMDREHVQNRIGVLDFTPLQQKDFDVQFAMDSLQMGVRPKDVEFVLTNASPLGPSKKAIYGIMKEAKAAIQERNGCIAR